MFSELDFEQMLRDTAGLCDAEWSPDEIEQIVIMIRFELYNRGVACGPKAIRTKMDESYGVKPLPPEQTIAQMLATNGLTYGRIGWCDGDEKWLPVSAIQAKQPSQGVCPGDGARRDRPSWAVLWPSSSRVTARKRNNRLSKPNYIEDTTVIEALTRP